MRTKKRSVIWQNNTFMVCHTVCPFWFLRTWNFIWILAASHYIISLAGAVKWDIWTLDWTRILCNYVSIWTIVCNRSWTTSLVLFSSINLDVINNKETSYFEKMDIYKQNKKHTVYLILISSPYLVVLGIAKLQAYYSDCNIFLPSLYVFNRKSFLFFFFVGSVMCILPLLDM